jgi:hypothetical protein
MTVRTGNLFVFIMGLVTGRNLIDVGVGEWKRGTRGVILQAEAISVGVGVALSNLQAGVGYLGFFTSDSVSLFRGMVRAVLAEASRPQVVRLWYSGGALTLPGEEDEDTENINAQTAQLQNLVNRAFDQAGFVVAYNRWLTVGKCLDMTLHCGTGQCNIHVFNQP